MGRVQLAGRPVVVMMLLLLLLRRGSAVEQRRWTSRRRWRQQQALAAERESTERAAWCLIWRISGWRAVEKSAVKLSLLKRSKQTTHERDRRTTNLLLLMTTDGLVLSRIRCTKKKKRNHSAEATIDTIRTIHTISVSVITTANARRLLCMFAERKQYDKK